MNALLTLVIILGFLLTPFKWIIFLAAADFLLRRIIRGRFSFISRISHLTTGVLGLKRISINAGPKLFAANVGFLLSLTAGLFYFTGLHGAAYALAGTLAFFTLLESFFNICVACILYPAVARFLQ